VASGLLGLLDDMVALAKLAAASVDDVTSSKDDRIGGWRGHR